MRKFIVLWLALMLVGSLAFAAESDKATLDQTPIALDSGGPDDYGYSWEDNDNGGSPEYNWIDITSIGTELEGLADDNSIGPIFMGFDFPYYWYEVDRMWIGSNGYVSFSSSANFAHPFAGIPTSAAPNVLVAVLTGDLDFTAGTNPQCFYYSNDVDTFIVSYLNVPEYAQPNTSSHTCQVIFSAADTTIKFQYGPNTGDFTDTNGANMTVIGIENVNGLVGLEYQHNNTVDSLMWHENLAIEIHPDPDPSFVIHDFGVLDGFHNGSGGVFVQNNAPYTMRAIVKNFGNQPESFLEVNCQVYGTTYNEQVIVEALEAGEAVTVEFSAPFIPTSTGDYRVFFTTSMTDDDVPVNNSKTCELVSYVLPQELSFVDDLPEASRSWSGDHSGYGFEFQVPEPIRMTQASFYVDGITLPGPAYVWVLPDNGSGNPDESNPIAGDTLNITTGGWIDVDFSGDNLTFAADELFWVVALHAFQGTFTFGMDASAPLNLSYRGWEHVGGMSPSRYAEVEDPMFKIEAEAAVGIDDEQLPTTFSVAQNYPNPFNASTNISFTLENSADVSIEIYNLIGQNIANLSGHYQSGENTVNWDASDISSGLYFYKIAVGESSETRKMVLIK